MFMNHLSHDDHVSQSLFSLPQGLVLRSWDVCFYSAVSRWVTCYVVAWPLWHVVIGSLVDYFFVFRNFYFDRKYHVLSRYYIETIHNWRLWWLPSSVVCGILFKNINSCSVMWSSSMNPAGTPHFHVPCPACVLFWLSRSATATLFVNVFTLFAIVSIATEEPSVEHAEVFIHTSCTDNWLRTHQPQIGANHSWSIDPRGPGRRLEYKQRQHAPLPALPMPGAGCCAQNHNTVNQNFDAVCAGEGVRAQSLIYSQQRTHHFWRHHPAFNAYVTISRHPNTSIHSKFYCWHNTVH